MFSYVLGRRGSGEAGKRRSGEAVRRGGEDMERVDIIDTRGFVFVFEIFR